MGDETTVALNRRARHDFTIDETFEAGIVLTGTEIKSHPGRQGQPVRRLRPDRARRGVADRRPHRAVRAGGNRYNHEPKRTRKLLLHRSEIDELLGKTKAKGQTIVPLRLYINEQGPGQDRARARPRQAAPRPPPRHRRPRRAARRRPRAGRRAARPVAMSATSRRRSRCSGSGRSIEAVDAHAAASPGG